MKQIQCNWTVAGDRLLDRVENPVWTNIVGCSAPQRPTHVKIRLSRSKTDLLKFLLFSAFLFSVLLLGERTTKAQSSFATEAGHVEFRSTVPLHSFTGSSELLNGRISLADSTVDFYVDLSTLKTGNGKRDKDMRKTLNTKEYPFAEFFGKLTTPFDPNSDSEQSASVSGTFSIHGIKRDVVVNGTLRSEGDQLLLSATWEISNDNYEIVPPRLLIMKVDDIQTVSIAVSLTREIP